MKKKIFELNQLSKICLDLKRKKKENSSMSWSL